MSLFRRDPEPADRPNAHPVIDTPTTVADCQADYAQAGTTYPAGQHTATPHTHGRRH